MTLGVPSSSQSLVGALASRRLPLNGPVSRSSTAAGPFRGVVDFSADLSGRSLLPSALFPSRTYGFLEDDPIPATERSVLRASLSTFGSSAEDGTLRSGAHERTGIDCSSPPSAFSRSTGGNGKSVAPSLAPFAAELSSHAPERELTHVSEDAERFARRHGLWGSIIFIKSWIAGYIDAIDGARIDLVIDREVDGWATLCLTIRTRAGLETALNLDARLRETIGESIACRHLPLFAVRFDFAG